MLFRPNFVLKIICLRSPRTGLSRRVVLVSSRPLVVELCRFSLSSHSNRR